MEDEERLKVKVSQKTKDESRSEAEIPLRRGQK